MNTRLLLALALLCHLLASPPSARAQGYEKVFDFTNARTEDVASVRNTDSEPRGGLVLARDGNFYGVTEYGGGNSRARCSG